MNRPSESPDDPTTDRTETVDTDKDVERLPDSETPTGPTTEDQAADMDYEGDTPN
ncbi:hypothetical protein ACWEKT_07995 [Nocardia takedensis]